VLCTSLSILHGWKASRLVHGGRYGVGLSVKVGLGLRGLCLCWGKPRLVTSWSRPGPVVVPKPLAMVHLSVLPSPLAILPPPPSRFLPLALYCLFSWHLTAYLPPGWHPTATYQLAPYCPVAPLASLSSPIDALLLGYAQPWYCTACVAAANALIERYNYRRDRCLRLQCWPTFLWFFSHARSLFSPSGPCFEALAILSFVLGSLRKDLGLSTCTFL